MYSRHWLYVIAMSIGAFAVGICMTSIIRWPAVSSAVCLLAIGVIVATGADLRRPHDSGQPQERSISRSIYRQVTLLTRNGYVSLVPRTCSDNKETERLLIGIDHHGTAYVERVERSGALRRYSISEDGGTVRRSVASGNITDADYAWCHEEPIYEHLKNLLSTLTGVYLPVRSVTL